MGVTRLKRRMGTFVPDMAKKPWGGGGEGGGGEGGGDGGGGEGGVFCNGLCGVPLELEGVDEKRHSTYIERLLSVTVHAVESSEPCRLTTRSDGG